MVLSVPGVRRVSRAEPKGGRGQALSRHVSQRDERLPGQSVGDQLLLGRPGGGLRKPSGEREVTFKQIPLIPLWASSMKQTCKNHNFFPLLFTHCRLLISAVIYVGTCQDHITGDQ